MTHFTAPLPDRLDSHQTPRTRRTLHGIVAALCALLTTLIVACDKMPMNGDLDGMWQLTTIVTPDSVSDVSNSHAYVSFQLQLVQWDDIDAERRYFSHFTHTADSLIFYDFAHPSKYAVGNNQNEWITPAEMHAGIFDAWGIHAVRAPFRIRQLDSSHMQLQQADTTLVLRKF